MKRVTTMVKNLWKDESGQGATEYILLLVVVVALAMLFRNSIRATLNDKLEELGTSIRSFTGE